LKIALFKRHLIHLILSGAKTQTRRIHQRQWKVGNTYKIKDTYYCKGLGTIKITRSFKQRLGDISEQDAQKEGFKTCNEFIDAWNTIKGSWNPDTIVTVYEFILVEKDNEKAIR
jgi:hypothetical protein